LILLFLFLGLLLLWLYWPLGSSHRQDSLVDPDAVPRVVTARGDLASDEQATIKLFEEASKSVVYITRLAIVRNSWTMNPQAIPEGTGSGFIWDDKGHVVTNNHVVQGADAARVTLYDHTTYGARLVGASAENDLAVVKIDTHGKKLQPILIGSSNDLKVGQKTFAIGNPFGLDQTLTTGVVSALGREIESSSKQSLHGMIQTDAAINPGNSGGPLLDSSGRLIGVNTAIYSPSGAYAGIGFAIPVDTVNEVVTQIIRGERVSPPRLGIQVADPAVARKLGVTSGVLVMRLVPGGPAEEAGLKPTRRNQSGDIVLGDVVVALDGQPVKTVRDLTSMLNKHKPGDAVKVTVLRDEERVDVEVVLQAG
jgi:S1-C subfamily serine protease